MIADLVEPFLAHMRARGQTPRNVQSFYGYPLRSIILPWLAGEGIEEAEDLTPAALDRLAIAIGQRTKRDGAPISAATRIAYLKAAKYFAQYVGADGRQLRPGALRRKRKDVLTKREVDLLEAACIHERNRLIVRLLYETGCREGELAGATLDDLLALGGGYYFLRVRGKTGERKPPIPAELYRRLRAYMKDGRRRTASRAIFIQEKRRAGHPNFEALTESGIYRVVKDAADRAQLEKRCYPHLLRASAITRMTAAGMHPALVSEITGVSVAVIANHYSYPSDEDKWEAMARLWR